jgi:transposase
MRPQTPISDEARERLGQLLSDATLSKSDYQHVLCLWLRAEFGWNHRQVAKAVGWCESHVKRVWAKYLREGEQALLGEERGGRRRENLTVEEESDLLAGFDETAQSGGLLVVSVVHAAYEERLGRKVPKSTLYRMLARHGWRKILPRPRHPKNDPDKAAAFKKNSADS